MSTYKCVFGVLAAIVCAGLSSCFLPEPEEQIDLIGKWDCPELGDEFKSSMYAAPKTENGMETSVEDPSVSVVFSEDSMMLMASVKTIISGRDASGDLKISATMELSGTQHYHLSNDTIYLDGGGSESSRIKDFEVSGSVVDNLSSSEKKQVRDVLKKQCEQAWLSNGDDDDDDEESSLLDSMGDYMVVKSYEGHRMILVDAEWKKSNIFIRKR